MTYINPDFDPTKLTVHLMGLKKNEGSAGPYTLFSDANRNWMQNKAGTSIEVTPELFTELKDRHLIQVNTKASLPSLTAYSLSSPESKAHAGTA